jgi:hypothetical protein
VWYCACGHQILPSNYGLLSECTLCTCALSLASSYPIDANSLELKPHFQQQHIRQRNIFLIISGANSKIVLDFFFSFHTSSQLKWSPLWVSLVEVVCVGFGVLNPLWGMVHKSTGCLNTCLFEYACPWPSLSLPYFVSVFKLYIRYLLLLHISFQLF